MFVVEKSYPVNNHIFKIDIENTRTQGAKYVKAYHKDTRTFFLLLTLNKYLFLIIYYLFIYLIIC